MLIAFMTHLELCFEIKDKQVLDYIHKVEPNLTDTRYIPLFSWAHQDRNSQACVGERHFHELPHWLDTLKPSSELTLFSARDLAVAVISKKKL